MNTDANSNTLVDKTKIPPLHQKRILAFVNQFLITSCTFLNEFAIHCESKFIELERKLQKTEASLIILEAKLASIPDSDGNEQIETTGTSTPIPVEKSTDKTTLPPAEDATSASEPEASIKPESQLNGVRACEDLRYKKYFKMIQVGVPTQAVKLKIQAEGLSPDILDTPEQILADGVSA